MNNIRPIILMAALVLATPVNAHPLDVREQTRSTTSAFAGVRLRILAKAEYVEPRLDLTLAPMLRSQASDGRSGLQ